MVDLSILQEKKNLRFSKVDLLINKTFILIENLRNGPTRFSINMKTMKDNINIYEMSKFIFMSKTKMGEPTIVSRFRETKLAQPKYKGKEIMGHIDR